MKLLEIVLLLDVLTANSELTVTVPENLQKHQELKNRYEYSTETAVEIKNKKKNNTKAKN